MIFTCRNIEKSYGSETIIENITFNLDDKEKIAVVGVNGAGKTTLFKIISGEISADSGEVNLKKDSTIGYLRQNAVIEGKGTVYEEALSVFCAVINLEKELRDMEQKMALIEGDELERYMGIYSKLQHEFEEKGGYVYKSRVKGVLKGLGFSQGEFEKPIKILSGGEKTRVFLSKLLLENPNILLLDEPTNHLDIWSINWLEDFLKGYQGAVVIISHDRYFMNKIVTKVVEIENKKSSVFEGDYSTFAVQKDINRQVDIKKYNDQQKEIKRQEDVIKTLRSFNREKSIKRAESREKNLEKMDIINKPDSLPSKMKLTLTPQVISGNDVVFAEDLCKKFPDKVLFENVSMDIKRGEKVAIIGPNGIGKSTLFKILLGKEKSDMGNIRFGANVNVGYYDQEQQYLDSSKTIFQEIADEYPNMKSGEIRNILAMFVFENDEVFKRIGDLSGGERGRVSLAKIMLGKSNLLMLDEPTNHLDMFSKSILENAVNRYEGSVVYISHDRYFINETADKIFELTPNGINVYMGNYDYYAEKKASKEKEEKLFAVGAETVKEVEISATKLDWQAQKEQQTQERRLKNKLIKLEKEIEEKEIEVAEFEEKLGEKDVSTNAVLAQEIYEKKVDAESRLVELLEEWEALCSEI